MISHAKFARITPRVNITVYSRVTDARASLSDQSGEIDSTCAKRRPKGPVWWTRHIGINVDPVD
jgi:hypothetical protein